MSNFNSDILYVRDNLVPRSLVDEAEGEIWPNPICITWSPVRNVTREASAHAQHKFVKAKADFDAIFARISKFHCFHETKQIQNEVERFFLQLGRICFRILLENFSDFYKVLSQFAFRNMIILDPRAYDPSGLRQESRALGATIMKEQRK